MQSPKGAHDEENVFHELVTRIQVVNQHLDNLEKFIAALDSSPDFDTEDRETLKIKRRQLEETRNGLQRTYDHRKNIYDQQVQAMQRSLNARQSILNGVDKETKIFNTFPELLTFFAAKQTNLNSQLEGVKKKLIEVPCLKK